MPHTNAPTIPLEESSSQDEMGYEKRLITSYGPVGSEIMERECEPYHGKFARFLFWLTARFLCLMGCLLIGYTIYKQAVVTDFEPIQMWTNASSSATLALLGVWAHLHYEMKSNESR